MSFLFNSFKKAFSSNSDSSTQEQIVSTPQLAQSYNNDMDNNDNYTSYSNNNNNNNNNFSSSTKSAPGDKKMAQAYAASKDLLLDRLNEEDKKILENATESDIVVVEGTYDHIHNVLAALHIPFKQIGIHQVASFEFRRDQTVYVNCPSSFPLEGAKRLADFVKEGGLLITTDWALEHVLHKAFPGTVKYNGKSTPDAVVGIEVLDKEDEVVKGFLDEDKEAAPQWWLESSSYPIEILDDKNVKVLVRSKELGEKWGSEAVIVRFSWGKGTVYHLISHFYLQRSETRNEKHKAKASTYFAAKGATTETVQKMESLDEVDYGTVQSAYTASEFVTKAYIAQKKKASKF